MSKTIINGIIAGAIAIFMFVVAYLIDRELIFNPILYWASMFPFIVMMWLSIRDAVTIGDEHKSLLRAGFVCFLIANAVYFIYYFVMMKYVAHDLHVLKIEEMNKAMMELDRLPGAATEPLNTNITLWGVLLSYFQGAIGGFVLSLLLVFMNKKK